MSANKKLFFQCIIGFLLFPLIASAQVTIQGKVTDTKTGEPLPAANIFIKNTYKGTITNDQGRYSLNIPSLPADIVFRYIGYKSVHIHLDSTSSGHLDIKLQPTTLQMGEVVVTGKDPAINIMRKVIERKQQWEKKLNTYKADAYTRQVMANDTGIVSVMESLSNVYWDRKKGSREVILTKRQTANVASTQNFAGSSYIPNFYDDNIDVAGYKMVGPTNPKALDFYDFKLKDYRYQDNKLIYDIEVIPKRKLQPTFVGTVSVLNKEYALVAVDLKPGSSVFFPPPVKDVKIHYQQQFYNFGKDFWLPVDFRVNGLVKIAFPGLDFPPFKFRQVSRLTNYKVNVSLPDSLYEKKKKLYVDSLTVHNDSLFSKSKDVVPLSKNEEAAYTHLDSTLTFAKAFKPTGFLSKYVNMNDGESSGNKKSKSGILDKVTDGLSPELWYNRVDAGHLGLGLDRNITKRLSLQLDGGYNTGIKKSSYGGGFKYKWGKNRNGSIGFHYGIGTRTQYKSDIFTKTEASYLPLLGRYDYFDYFWNQSFTTDLSYRIRKWNSTVKIGYEDALQSSLNHVTSYDLLGRHNIQRINPSIDEGWMRSVSFTYIYGDEFVPFSPIGQKRIVLNIEHSSPGILQSDFDFTRYQFSIDWRFDTFFRRRFLPNVLDIRLVGGTYSGRLPLQRFGIIDAALGGVTPFGSFKTIRSNPYEGESYLGLFWEHNFRTVPFELLGLHELAKKGLGIIVFGAHGRTWIHHQRLAELRQGFSPKYFDGFQNELGLSLNGLFGILRLDVAKNLNQPNLYFGVSVARIF